MKRRNLLLQFLDSGGGFIHAGFVLISVLGLGVASLSTLGELLLAEAEGGFREA